MMPKGEKCGIKVMMGKYEGEIVVKQGLGYMKSNK
jgi:hypothetical protein